MSRALSLRTLFRALRMPCRLHHQFSCKQAGRNVLDVTKCITAVTGNPPTRMHHFIGPGLLTHMRHITEGRLNCRTPRREFLLVPPWSQISSVRCMSAGSPEHVTVEEDPVSKNARDKTSLLLGNLFKNGVEPFVLTKILAIHHLWRGLVAMSVCTPAM